MPDNIQRFEFTPPAEEEEYNFFPKTMEEDEGIFFHATELKNLQSILEKGFILSAHLRSCCYSKKSSYLWSHRDSSKKGDFVSIAVRFSELPTKGILLTNIDLRIYDQNIQPEIIGYCIIPDGFILK